MNDLVREEMNKQPSRRSLKNKVTGPVVEKRFGRTWVRLSTSVAAARAGLIPSCETDACPPPEGLTVKQLLRWHRGLPVLCKNT